MYDDHTTGMSTCEDSDQRAPSGAGRGTWIIFDASVDFRVL